MPNFFPMYYYVSTMNYLWRCFQHSTALHNTCTSTDARDIPVQCRHGEKIKIRGRVCAVATTPFFFVRSLPWWVTLGCAAYKVGCAYHPMCGSTYKLPAAPLLPPSPPQPFSVFSTLHPFFRHSSPLTASPTWLICLHHRRPLYSHSNKLSTFQL